MEQNVGWKIKGVKQKKVKHLKAALTCLLMICSFAKAQEQCLGRVLGLVGWLDVQVACLLAYYMYFFLFPLSIHHTSSTPALPPLPSLLFYVQRLFSIVTDAFSFSSSLLFIYFLFYCVFRFILFSLSLGLLPLLSTIKPADVGT